MLAIDLLVGKCKSIKKRKTRFALPPTSLEDLEYYELFFRDTLSLETSHLDHELLKSK